MSLLKHLVVLAAILPIAAIAGETISQPVKHYRYDASGDYLYIVGPNSWGNASCPNATYVNIKPNLAGRRQMFAAVASAHASGKTVKFFGECGTNPDYFDATYIVVE